MKHDKDVGEYMRPKPYKAGAAGSGYPNKVSKTQTTRVRGCGAATKGCGASSKMG